jgi:hypothetical protein
MRRAVRRACLYIVHHKQSAPMYLYLYALYIYITHMLCYIINTTYTHDCRLSAVCTHAPSPLDAL